MSTFTTAAMLLASMLQTPAAKRPVLRPAQIVLIRHAEKPADESDPHLSAAGVTRAHRLVSFITTDAAMTRFGPPVAVFATRTTKDGNGQRTQETVAPLALALKLTVLAPYTGAKYAELAAQIRTNPAYAGKTVVICWNHEELPQLAAALGVTPSPPKWKDRVFDEIYIITYHDGNATLSVSHYPGS